MQEYTKICIIVPNKDKYGNHISNFYEKLKPLDSWLIEKFGGFSMYDGYGGYKFDNGKTTNEAHKKYEVLIETYTWDMDELFKSKCELLARLFKQECILCTKEVIQASFVC